MGEVVQEYNFRHVKCLLTLNWELEGQTWSSKTVQTRSKILNQFI